MLIGMKQTWDEGTAGPGGGRGLWGSDTTWNFRARQVGVAAVMS